MRHEVMNSFHSFMKAISDRWDDDEDKDDCDGDHESDLSLTDEAMTRTTRMVLATMTAISDRWDDDEDNDDGDGDDE